MPAEQPRAYSLVLSIDADTLMDVQAQVELLADLWADIPTLSSAAARHTGPGIDAAWSLRYADPEADAEGPQPPDDPDPTPEP